MQLLCSFSKAGIGYRLDSPTVCMHVLPSYNVLALSQYIDRVHTILWLSGDDASDKPARESVLGEGEGGISVMF